MTRSLVPGRKTIVLGAILFSLLGLFVAVTFRSGPFSPVPVTVVTVESRALTPSLFGIGIVEARYTHKLGPTFTARLRNVDVEPGDRVTTGQLLGEMIERGDRPEAVFCCDDLLALGVLFECQRRGIKVPDEMSIIGFNNLEFAACAYPALATVVTPRYEMGRLAAEIVRRIIESGQRPADNRIDVGYSLELRGSVRRPH